jgi:hypothetical protein
MERKTNLFNSKKTDKSKKKADLKWSAVLFFSK